MPKIVNKGGSFFDEVPIEKYLVVGNEYLNG